MDINERLDRIEKNLSELRELITMLLSAPIETEVKKQEVVRPVMESSLPLPVKTEAEVKQESKIIQQLVTGSSPPKLTNEPVKTIDNLKLQNQQKLQNQLNPTLPASSDQAILPQLINLLNSKEWPHAVDPALICDISSDQDKEDRAEGILDLIIDIHLENLKFLDFGCGEGHVVNRSRLQKPKMSVGYDIKKSDRWEKWEKTPNIHFTDNWDEVKNFAPYNIVLMYDVIDHMLELDKEIIERMQAIKKILAVGGKVFIRTHPFCSRHGTHLYHQINKAFVHLVFTEQELESLGYKQEKVRKVLTPLWEYNNIFTAAGFKVQSGPHIIKEGVESFFVNNPLISQRIKDNYKNCGNEALRSGKFPLFQLEQQFVDFVLV
jgi:2-polyprenyl-3-methyl-5-hydroxy-6-metoxy-1,4-benzoquinol methylase